MKKWHGFDELARLLPEVAIVGTPSDLDNQATYFRRPFDWAPHARCYIGQLNLRDTAALLAQCAALVSNDSGMMHLGVAAGIPTFGIFGITGRKVETATGGGDGRRQLRLPTELARDFCYAMRIALLQPLVAIEYELSLRAHGRLEGCAPVREGCDLVGLGETLLPAAATCAKPVLM